MAGGGYSSGFNPYVPGYRSQFLAKGLGAAMWFFIFYRARKDGAKLIGRHPVVEEAHGRGGHH